MYGQLYGTTEGRNVVLNPVPSHLKAKKCKFGVTRLGYVGRVIFKEGLSMSAEKIKSV